MYIRALGLLLFLTRVLLAQEPTPILPDANMTPGDTFDVTAQDICTHGYARKVRDVPAKSPALRHQKTNRAVRTKVLSAESVLTVRGIPRTIEREGNPDAMTNPVEFRLALSNSF